MRRTLVHFALVPFAAALAHSLSGCAGDEATLEVKQPVVVLEDSEQAEGAPLDELRALHSLKAGTRR